MQMIYEPYLDAVRALDLLSYRQKKSSNDLCMHRAGELTVEYAPFDHLESGAKLVIVGLTPGRMQAANALASLAHDLNDGLPLESSLARAKRTASFSGPMRANLLAMLDAVGIPAAFNKKNSSEFFNEDSLVHFTSTLRYPVYINGENHSGNPPPLQHPILKSMIENYLAEEASRLGTAIWVPLGKHAEASLLHLSQKGMLRRGNIPAGLPHPSGANAERIAYFLGRKRSMDLSAKTNAAQLDENKRRLIAQLDVFRKET